MASKIILIRGISDQETSGFGIELDVANLSLS